MVVGDNPGRFIGLRQSDVALLGKDLASQAVACLQGILCPFSFSHEMHKVHTALTLFRCEEEGGCVFVLGDMK